MADVFFIAEAGVNHNGSLARALELVDIAAEAGADAVKFQTFKAADVAAASARKAEYQARETGAGESQLAMLKALELSDDEFRRVRDRCDERRIEFMSTPFDVSSLDLLARTLKVKRLKCPSGEITNGPFMLAMARTGLPIILSTGMADIDEIADALAVLAFGYLSAATPSGLGELRDFVTRPQAQAVLRDKVTVLHCTSAYPAPMSDLNLRAMTTIAERFGVPVGYSDHSNGLHVSIAAVAMGAVCIEKHFTSDRNLPGPDHKASLEPEELATLVAHIRDITAALGHREKVPTRAEQDTMAVARRSLIAARPISAGSRFALDSLTALRPGGGLSPMQVWDLQAHTASRAYAAGEPIDASDRPAPARPSST